MVHHVASHSMLRDLGHGLVMRRARPDDADALAEFNGRIHGRQQPDPGVAALTHDLLTRPHPTVGPDDFTVVEDTATGAIVSSMNLISQTWTYGGIEFGVGRPELVGTEPGYRKRGLVRAQFEVIHGWSAERGELLQAITGIPSYYRQFGYEMSLDLGGGRGGYAANIPQLKEGEPEPFTVRPATEADIPFIARVYEARERYVVECKRDAAVWRYELSGRSERNCNRGNLGIIESAEGEAVGFIGYGPKLWSGSISAGPYELKPGVTWLAVTPSVLRFLQSAGRAYGDAAEPKQECTSFMFWCGSDHPAYSVIDRRLPRKQPPYAWYIRVPDLPRFIERVGPVLEGRLAASPLVGHSGELKLSFYRSGLRLAFEEGRLSQVEGWQPGDGAAAAFPGHTFLQLVFGYRTLEELQRSFPDCWSSDDAWAILPVLFPRRPANVWPVG